MVRPHPLEVNPEAPGPVLQRVRTRFSEEMRRLGVDARIELYQRNAVVRASDVCVFSLPSSAMVECMILDRPVVLYAEAPLCDREYLVPATFWAPGVLESAYNAPGVILERQIEWLPSLNHGNDGKASERVVELIGELIDGRS